MSSVDLDETTHAARNTFPALLGDDDTIETIVFLDVGTGNCNLLCGAGSTPLFYFDFGGNGRRGARTYPYKARPDKKNDSRPIPNFPQTSSIKLVVSHWDEDHVYSLKAQPDMKDCAWLGPREDLAPGTARLLAKTAKNLRVWNNTTDSATVEYKSKKGVKVELVRCIGNAMASDKTNRNDVGIAMIVEIETPTRAEAAAKAIEEHAAKNANDSAGAVLKGNAVKGHDVYREAVLTAAAEAAKQYPSSAGNVAAAARAAVSGKAVKAATLAILAAVDAVEAAKTVPRLVYDAAYAACQVLDEPAAKVLDAMSKVVDQDAAAVTNAGAAILVFVERALIDALRAAVAASTKDSATAADVLKDATEAAGLLHAGTPPVKAVLDAIGIAVTNNAGAADAASHGITAAKGGLALTATVAALQAARTSSDAPNALKEALGAVVGAMKPLYPMFGRAMTAAQGEVTKGSNVGAIAEAMVGTLDAATGKVRAADGPAVLLKMKQRLLQASPKNDAIDEAAEKPKKGEHYAHSVIKTARKKIGELKKKEDPQEVWKAALAALDDVPKQWKTRVLLTGDGCFQAVPANVLEDTEWDLLLAYHHGSRDHFADGDNLSDRADAPVPVLKDVSTIVYCAGKDPDGVYVYNHPESEAIEKYEAAGWTVALHTHPWPKTTGQTPRGDRTYSLPYAT